MYDTLTVKSTGLVSKNNHLNNEIVSMKNKISILEKLSDVKAEKGVALIKNSIIKLMQTKTYKESIRNYKTFIFYTQEEFINLLNKEMSEDDISKVFEYSKERGQTKISNHGVM